MMNNVFNFNEEEYIKCFSKNIFQLPLTLNSEDYYEDLNNILELYKTESSKIGIQFEKKIKEICEHLIQTIDKCYKGCIIIIGVNSIKINKGGAF
jgi:hypothetical protein